MRALVIEKVQKGYLSFCICLHLIIYGVLYSGYSMKLGAEAEATTSEIYIFICTASVAMNERSMCVCVCV